MAKLPEPLEFLRDVWLAIVAPPRRRATIAAACLVAIVATFVARVGTIPFRIGALVLLVLAGAGVVAMRLFDRRVFADPARTIRRVAGRADPELAARAVRALSLLRPDAVKGASAELAQLHVRRALASLPDEGVRRSASRIAFVFGVAALAFAVLDVAACASNPWGVVEGADILAARGGVAPLGMAWLSDPNIQARPPDYLHQEERRLLVYDDDISLPRGTLLTVRGTPVHAGRRLLLTDGSAEVPFVDDGSGHVVARWPLGDSVKLRVVARFGDVVIPDARETPIESIPDLPPVVALEGAPNQIRLASDHETSEIPIHYEATDDHGLREVHLVLRAGAREERRVLARLDGETKSDRGGYTLRATDSFIKKSHAPIEIRVEAKDNDPITGPKWGASAAITVVPPDVGEPQSRRLAALVKVRDALVDALAWRLSSPVPDLTQRKEYFAKDGKLDDDVSALLDEALSSSYAGVRVPPRIAAMLRGKMRKLKEATGNQARSPSTAAHANVVKANERFALVVDAVVQGLGLRDTRDVARELAEVADDLALASTLAQKHDEKVRGEQRMDAAVVVLDGGGKSMRKLGPLGRDIGEIVEMDLSRVARARKGSDLPHASLAAQDLAARLRQPDPSFGARGGRPSHAGGESGGGRGAEGAEREDDGSDVEQAFNEAAQELERLAADHATEMGKTEQSLAGAASKEDVDRLSDEAKKHAQKVREAADPLPTVGGGSDSWTSKGAAAREHAEQMAKALESGNAADAVQSGRSALGALDEAKRMAARERWGRLTESGADKTIDDAKKGLESELKWAEDKLEELRKKAAQRAGPELREHGDNEAKLADRAGDVRSKGRDQELPQAALDALRDAEQAAREAARALAQGDAEKGLAKQREAQQKLDMANDALGEEGESEGGQGDDGEKMSHEHAEIPKADAHKGPEEFRRRVIKGLGQPAGGKYKDAVKRYAEGLLR